MKIRNWLIKCALICLASVCLCVAGGFLRETVREESRLPEKVLSSSTFSHSGCSFSASALQCGVPRNSTSANSLRTFQSQRQNSSNSARTGFAIVKAGKSMNEYSTSLFFKSILDFPSGMNKVNHHLIGLGKLII